MTVLFCDRDLGKLFPSVLRQAGLVVETHGDHFPDNESDDRWLTEVGRRGWYALTHNERIRYTPNERDAVMLARVGLFILIGAATSQSLAENFVRTWPSVQRFIEQQTVPFIAKVFRPGTAVHANNPDAPGRVEMWLTDSQWRRTYGQRRRRGGRA